MKPDGTPDMPDRLNPLLRRFLPGNLVGFGADFLLSGMVVGPVIAPFLAASNGLMLPIGVDRATGLVANIIYFMGQHVCPQPEMGVVLSPPWMMAVCMRCYGTVMGLLLTRLLYGMNRGRAFYWLHQYGWPGTMLTAVLMMAYPIELAAQNFGLWSFDNWVVTGFGLITGLAWGLHAMPILHNDYSAQDDGSETNRWALPTLR